MKIELRHEEKILECELQEYDYAHGLGVEAIFYLSGSPIGRIRFLCDREDEMYPDISKYSYEEIASKLGEALQSNIYADSLKNMDIWQSEINRLGHSTISPIYGRIANAF